MSAIFINVRKEETGAMAGPASYIPIWSKGGGLIKVSTGNRYRKRDFLCNTAAER